ncbi:MAG: hypothetical protein SGI72_08825 [Planctomycetota bacterium]|nr:hypothetical protein [Planctomycetota bacterium]
MILAAIVLALAQQATPATAQPVRPRDPFVFRCVLDKRARMLVAALDEDMWAAWDTTNGAFVKAWKGGVAFDGAVYTTVHGPQPTTRGSDYTSGADANPWIAYVDGKAVATSAAYVGYTLEAGRVTLEWKLTFGANREVSVRERPEFTRPNQLFSPDQIADAELGLPDAPALRRDFEATGLKAGEQVNVVIRTDGTRQKIAQSLERERFEDVEDAQGVVSATRVWSQLPMTAKAPHNSIVLVFAPIALAKAGVPK